MRIQELEAEVGQLKALLNTRAEAKAAKKPKFTEDYCFSKNKQEKKRGKGPADHPPENLSGIGGA